LLIPVRSAIAADACCAVTSQVTASELSVGAILR
jgi:hypothetical protein